ncbi:MAG: hypothetical protein IKO52_11095, partial [Clostridia bacterium]|nr:hypothetical protein [Clostridia bacterium]
LQNLQDNLRFEFWTVVLVIHGFLSLVFYSTMFTFFSLLLVQFHGDIIYRQHCDKKTASGSCDRIGSRKTEADA